MTSNNPLLAAYWLTIAFQLKGVRKAVRNAFVLEADRKHGLSLLEVMAAEPDELPRQLRAAGFGTLYEALIEADGRVSAQAFLVQAMREEGADVLPITHPGYPAHLAKSLKPAKAPTVLSVAGDVSLLSAPGIAVSGSRNAGPAGLRFARAIGRALAEAGVTVITGLARGIDTEATEGALEAGGSCVGVSAEGLLNTQARRRREVAEGRLTVVSEFAPRARWQGWMAMQRNHTIAGLSRALVIADCVGHGGTTAQFDVHRDLGFPVHVRRGTGEGALNEELASRPGGHPLYWDEGKVALSRHLLTGELEAKIHALVRTHGGGAQLTLDLPVGCEPERVIELVRAEWPDKLEPVVFSTPRSVPAAEEATDGNEDDVSAARAAKPDENEVVLTALKDAGAGGVTVKELAKATGWGDSKTRRRLKSMVEAGTAAEWKDGRSMRYGSPENRRSESEKSSEKETPQLALLQASNG